MIYTHQTQYYETDQMGIIHHSNYIRWMEEARVAYMEELGFPYENGGGSGIYKPGAERPVRVQSHDAFWRPRLYRSAADFI